MALNSAHGFFPAFLSIASPLNCHVELSLWDLTIYGNRWICSSVIFINDLSSHSKAIKLRLGKAWPLGACMQFSIVKKLHKALQEDLKRHQKIIWNSEVFKMPYTFSLLALVVCLHRRVSKLFNKGFPMRRCILIGIATLGPLGSFRLFQITACNHPNNQEIINKRNLMKWFWSTI